ncbi:MAG: DUF1249 domain-containing protein [Enterobacterales bacterium]|nr:DUF1249 domain-containing protein [Enterobacterales bacterium]
MKRYQPDLDEFISQCEVNYFLIIKLIPNLETKQNQVLARQLNRSLLKHRIGMQDFDFKLLETAKYTSTLLLKIGALVDKMPQDLVLMLRLYHDAKLLEVMDMSGPKAMRAIFTGRRLINRQKDEKKTDQPLFG